MSETMSRVRELAEKLFDAEQGPNPFPYSPWGRRPQLSDLWPCDQEKYIRMAEAALLREPR